VLGAPLGATLVAGGIGSWLLDQFFDNPSPAWLTVVGGLSLIFIVVTNPDGMAAEQARQARWLTRRIRAVLQKQPAPTRRTRDEGNVGAQRAARVAPATLRVDDLTVRFGGVTAVDHVSLRVPPGRVVGLIGPNGAGKTTLVDAISGFVRCAGGTVAVDGTRIDGWPAHRRVRGGLARSFQSLELLESATVLDNIRAACDPGRATSYLLGWFSPATVPITGPAWAAIHELQLADHLDDIVKNMPYSRRRLVAIARAIASSPSILMLDEPAAGLSEPERTELRRIVNRLAREWGMAILLIEHDMSFVMDVCEEILVLSFGHELATGSPDAIRTNPEVIGAYLGTPVAGSDGGADPPVSAGQAEAPERVSSWEC
jgi:sulfate-transporting ATPase